MGLRRSKRLGKSRYRTVAAFTAWTVDSLTRVGKTETAGSGTTVALTMARNETASFQVVVNGGVSGVPNVGLTVSDLTGPGGTISAASNVVRYREYYVNVSSGSVDWGGTVHPQGTGFYADGLIPFVDPATGTALNGTLKADGFNVPAGENQPYWIDIRIPTGTTIGTYTGTWTATSGAAATNGTITITVINATIPVAPHLRSSFLHWSGRDTVALELLRNRISPTDVAAANVSTWNSTYGLNAVNLGGFWSGADRETCTMSAAPSVGSISTAAAAKNVSGVLLYNYSADEIGSCTGLVPTVKAWARNLHDATPTVKQLITMPPLSTLYTDDDGGHGVDIWVLLPQDYQNNPLEANAAVAAGMTTWSYNALNQDDYSPKWLIDFRCADHRVHAGFLNEATDMTGLLYWKVDGWSASSNRWVDSLYSWTGSPNAWPGEGLLVYPGEEVGITGGAAPSIRLKWLRDGVTDYDYIQLAKTAGHGTAVADIVGDVCTDWTDWSQSNTVIKTARAELAALFGGPGGGGSPTMTSTAITTGADDQRASKSTDGEWDYIDDFGLRVGDSAATAYDWASLLRMTLNVPQGATINAATFTIQSDGAYGAGQTLKIQAFAADNATMPATGAAVTSAAKTTASVTWVLGAWTPGETITSPDISSVIQAVVNRPAWVAGNNILLFISDNTVGWPGTANDRLIIDYPGFASGLSVTYTA
jgi:hypothetical protein